MKHLFLIAAAALCALCGCTGKKAMPADTDTPNSDSTLILYYSQTGATETVARELQKQLGCDAAAIEAAVPYDGDYAATIARWQSEMAEGAKVAIKPLDIKLDGYRTIFLCFPIWGGTYASPVATFLADNDLSGKKVVTFATFGSGGLDKATADAAAAQPGAEVTRGHGIRSARIAKAPAELERFLIEGGYIAGEAEVLPAFSESAPVTEAESAVFSDACGSYQFPLGTLVEVASRAIP
ncbi:MAG: hypothetical protein K2K76_10420, partial [Muribaculaceae bacterium]|nr:hypothetical protein [Muribaculaceae bacterium]